MKKKSIKYRTLVLVALVLTTISCNEDWLKPEPLSFLGADNTYSTKSGIESLLIKCREGLRIEVVGKDCRIVDDYVYSDLAIPVNGGTKNLETEFLPSTGTPRDFWDAYFAEIKYANVVINRGMELDIPEEEKDPLVAEGYFFLGYWYYKLVNTFGDVPLVTEEISAPKLDFKTATKRLILETMITNLEYAVQHLPETVPTGSVNRAAGQHLLTKYYLQVGRFQDAVNMASKIIDNNNYALMTSRFGVDANDESKNIMWDLFRKYNPSLNENTEKILVVLDFPLTDGGTSGSERARSWETEWYKNIYDSKGKRGTVDGKAGEPQISFTNRGIGKSKKTNYFGYQLWNDPDDLRHKAPNWLPIDSLVYNNPSSKDYGKHLVKEYCTDTVRAWDCIFFNKIVVPDETLPVGEGVNLKGGTLDWYIFRLAETYLLRAEAYVWLNKSKEAANDINMIRTRAGAAPIAESNVTLDDVLDERARELYTEEFRRTELVRISYTKALLNADGYSLSEISRKNYYYDRMMDKNNFFKTQYTYGSKQYRINPFHVYWPVPESAIQDNTLNQLNQNYGYVGYENNVPPIDE
jgi:hypothetical protein